MKNNLKNKNKNIMVKMAVKMPITTTCSIIHHLQKKFLQVFWI